MTVGPISTLSTAAYNTASAAVNAVRNNPKTTAAVVLTAATAAVGYHNAEAVTAFAQKTLETLANAFAPAKLSPSFVDTYFPRFTDAPKVGECSIFAAPAEKGTLEIISSYASRLWS